MKVISAGNAAPIKKTLKGIKPIKVLLFKGVTMPSIVTHDSINNMLRFPNSCNF